VEGVETFADNREANEVATMAKMRMMSEIMFALTMTAHPRWRSRAHIMSRSRSLTARRRELPVCQETKTVLPSSESQQLAPVQRCGRTTRRSASRAVPIFRACQGLNRPVCKDASSVRLIKMISRLPSRSRTAEQV
jgi:hypothetical protein